MTKFISLLALLLAGVMLCEANPMDSIGVKKQEGKHYIIHKVEKGQGMLAIAKRYQVTVDQINAANPGLEKSGLKAGAEILIPYTPQASKNTSAKPPESTPRKDSPALREGAAPGSGPGNGTKGYHIVGPKETLTRIAVQYKISVDELKRINELKDNNLKVGQKLLVDPKLYKQAASPAMESMQTMSGQLLLDSRVDENKYLCFTSLVPEGKIVKLVNPVSKASVYVKVKAALPSEDPAQIRITGAALRKLGLEGNNSFSLEVYQSF